MPDINTRIDQLKGEFALGVYSPSQINTVLQILDDINAEIGGTPGGSGWALTGTTTLTGDCLIDLDANDLGFTGGNVGIGTDTPSVALEVSGDMRATTGGDYATGLIGTDGVNLMAWIGDLDDAGNSTLVKVDDSNRIITLNAIDGVTTSAGLNVAGATGAGTTDNAWLKIGQGTDDHAQLNFADSDTPINPARGNMWKTNEANLFFTDDSFVEHKFALFPSSGNTPYTGTVAGAAGKSVVNGIIMD